MIVRWEKIVSSLVLVVAVGCGGGGSSCSKDTPLECSNGTCCPRGYPYSCGNGYCYQYGCPPGSPRLDTCEFKVAHTDSEKKVAAPVPVIDEELAKMCVPEGYPEDETSDSGVSK